MKKNKMAATLLIIAATISSSIANESDFQVVHDSTNSCRPNCDAATIKVVGEGIISIWEKALNPKKIKDLLKNIGMMKSLPNSTQKIPYNKISLKLNEKHVSWPKCQPTCSPSMATEIGELYLQLWIEGEKPTKVYPD